ncbi:hypothetical protein MITS9504_01275 [Synechococcus sp. MIT S9504]|nr:hypothetical protein MITS9504_01275 [Synechococcus sp. MIT S9504]
MIHYKVRLKLCPAWKVRRRGNSRKINPSRMKRIAAVTAAAVLLVGGRAQAQIKTLQGPVSPPGLDPLPFPLNFERSLEYLIAIKLLPLLNNGK